jgi:hypothetical protein
VQRTCLEYYGWNQKIPFAQTSSLKIKLDFREEINFLENIERKGFSCKKCRNNCLFKLRYNMLLLPVTYLRTWMTWA